MNELKRCPFCDGKLKKSGSKRRGNQFYMHEYNGCILQIICFRTDDVESIEAWNTRKSMERIVELLEEESYDSMHIDMSRPMTETWQIIDLDKAIAIVKEEEGGLNE